MVSGNPEAEMKFRKKRKKFGSFYAFHGSNSGNWHCILRAGLKNYSNTNKMSKLRNLRGFQRAMPYIGESQVYM